MSAPVFDQSALSSRITRSIHFSQANLAGFEIGPIFFWSENVPSLTVSAANSSNNHLAFAVSNEGIVTLTGNSALWTGLNGFKLRVTDSVNGQFTENDFFVDIQHIRQDTGPVINDFNGSCKYEELDYPLWLYGPADWESNKNNIALSRSPAFTLTSYNNDGQLYTDTSSIGQQVIHFVRQAINNLPDFNSGVSYRTFVRSAGTRKSSNADGTPPVQQLVWVYSRNPDRRVRQNNWVSQDESGFTLHDGTTYAWADYYYQYDESNSNYSAISFYKISPDSYGDRVQISYHTALDPFVNPYYYINIYGGSYYKLHTTHPDEYYPFWLINGTDFLDANKFDGVSPLSTSMPANTSLQGWNIDDQFWDETIYPAGQITQQLVSFATQLMQNEPDKTAYHCKFMSNGGNSNGASLVITKFATTIRLTVFNSIFYSGSVASIKTNTFNAPSLSTQGDILYNRGRFGDRDEDVVTLVLNSGLIDGVDIGADIGNYSIQTSNDTFSILKDPSVSASTATYSFNITANSNNGGTNSLNVNFGVLSNSAPTFTANAQSNVVLYSNRDAQPAIYIDGTVSDAENDAITLSLTSGTLDGSNIVNVNDSYEVSLNGSLFSVSAKAGVSIGSGVYVFAVQADDGTNTTTANVQATIQLRPVISTSTINASLHHLSLDTPGTVIGSVSFGSENASSFAISTSEQGDNNHTAFSIDANGQVTLTGNVAVTSGNNSFKLTITDNTNSLQSEQIVTVNVTVTNQTPTIVANAQSLSVQYNAMQYSTLMFSGTFADADNDPITMTLLSGTFNGNAVNIADFSLAQVNSNFTISSVVGLVLQTGTYIFQVQASDGNLTQQAGAQVDITVAPSVSAQSIDVSIHHLFVNVLDTAVGSVNFSLEGTASLSVLQAAGDSNNHTAFTVTNQGAVKLSGVQAATEGSQTFLLRVTDSDNSTYTEATITVNVTITNTTPAISGPANTLSTAYSNRSSGLLIYQNGIFSDADSDPVTVTLLGVTIDGVAQDVANFTLTAANGLFSINSVQNYTMTSGAVVFSVSATDQRETVNADVSTTYTINPEISAGQQFNLNITAVEERDGDLGLFQVVGSGESALSFSLNSLANLFAIVANTGILKTKGAGDLISNGTYTISVTVTDSVNSAQATANVDVVVAVSRIVASKTFSNVTTTAQSMTDVTVGQNCVITAVNNSLTLGGTLNIDASSVIGDSDDVIVLQNTTISGGRFNYVSMGGSGSFTNCQFVGPTGLVQTLVEGAILTLYNSNI